MCLLPPGFMYHEYEHACLSLVIEAMTHFQVIKYTLRQVLPMSMEKQPGKRESC